MILPDPKTDNGFYQINKIILRENDSLHMEMRYSYIDLSLNSGLGDITEKNIKISQENKLFSHYLIANRHANGKDWWIVQATEKPDGFLTFLLNENGFSNPFLQTLDTSFHYNASASGSSAISPDGLHYAYFNPFDNLLFFEFNREDGTIHNLRKAKIFNGPESNASFSSIEFSSNSRFLYAAVGDSLWQVDLYENDLNDGIELIDVYDGTLDPFPTVFTQMALAPDCKIYIAPSSSTNSYHVINKPNEKGTSCDFVQRGIQLPFTSSTAGLPNFPKFRVDEDEKCDPTIGTMFGEVVFYRRDLTAFPNPSKGQVTIEIPEAINGQLYVFDMQGREVIQNIEINNRHEKQLDLTNLSSGSYTIEFIPLDTSEKLIWTNKIVIVK